MQYPQTSNTPMVIEGHGESDTLEGTGEKTFQGPSFRLVARQGQRIAGKASASNKLASGMYGGEMLQRMENGQKRSLRRQSSYIPRLFSLRRVPKRYWQILPLEVMRRYQCVVIGGEGDALTVAIADEESTRIFGVIRKLTGRKVFPVLIEPERMYLLLRRIEKQARSAQNKQHYLHRPFSVDLFPLDVHTILRLLIS
jgi:hypothetical protein